MRVCCAILLLAPLALCANVPRGQTVGQSDSPTVPPSALSWAPPSFDRYDSILSRMPFGQPPLVAANATNAATSAAPPPPPFVSKLSLCAINRTPAGPIAVGFTDASTNPPRGYYLNVGEDEDGYSVLSADIDQELATISKDGLYIDLKMGKGAVLGTATQSPAAPVAVAQPMIPASVSTQSFARASAGPPIPISPLNSSIWPVPKNLKALDAALKMGITNDSYVDKLKKRREEVLAQQAAASGDTKDTTDKTMEDKVAAQFEDFLRRKNLDLIRKGEPGLGIQLTPEEDAQLVRENVLPPQK